MTSGHFIANQVIYKVFFWPNLRGFLQVDISLANDFGCIHWVLFPKIVTVKINLLCELIRLVPYKLQ